MKSGGKASAVRGAKRREYDGGEGGSAGWLLTTYVLIRVLTVTVAPDHLIFFVHHPGTFVHRFKNRFLCPPFSMFTTLGANSCRLVILNAPIGVQGHGDKKNIIHSLSMQSRMFFGEE